MAKKESDINIKLPPQFLEGEEAVLGAMLSSKGAVSRALEILEQENFYKDANAKIFQTMVELFNSGEPVDAISVINRLKKKKQLDAVGGAYYITGLSETVPTTANVSHYAKIVLEKASLRRLIDVSSELSQSAYNDQAALDDILDEAEQKIFAISQNRMKGGFSQISPVLQTTFEHLDKIHQKPGTVTGIPSGLVDLDNLTSGFQQGEFIVIAGRPGAGKTSLAITIARNAAVDYKIPVGMFSLEMSNNQLAMRLLCAESRVDSHLVRTGKLPKTQWKNLSLSVGVLAEAQIYLDDTPAIGITEMRAKSRRLKAERDIQLLVLDYMQLMKGPRAESRQHEISVISRSLKSLAKELDIPVVALSQLSRAVESRADHRPQLSDLRESGAIEQDADVVMFVYRKWLYFQEEEYRGQAQIIVAKQRNGPTDTIPVTFVDKYAKFENLSPYEEEEATVPF